MKRKPVIRDVSPYSQHWISCRFPPNFNGPIWVYLPDSGNDDEGYGMTIVGRCEKELFGKGINSTWVDAYGREIEPTFWTYLEQVASPYIHPTADDARSASVAALAEYEYDGCNPPPLTPNESE